jgi:hypothetical protein
MSLPGIRVRKRRENRCLNISLIEPFAVSMVENPRIQQALRSLKLLYFDCGSRDQYQLQFGARLLARKMTLAGIPHEGEIFNKGTLGVSGMQNLDE